MYSELNEKLYGILIQDEEPTPGKPQKIKNLVVNKEAEELIEKQSKEIERLKKQIEEIQKINLADHKYASKMEDKYITANNIIIELEKWLEDYHNNTGLGEYETGIDDAICDTIKKLKELKGFGIFNGKLMGLNYNRELKRKYLKEHKKDKNATFCIFCKGKTLTITDDYNKPICELCGIEKKGDSSNG